MVDEATCADAGILVESTLRFASPRSFGRARHRRWLPALLAAVVLGALVVAPATATSQTLGPACASVNLRASASTGAAIVVKLNSTATLTVAGTVAGSSWRTSCPTAKSGSSWYKVTAVNGRSVSS
ncbi:MAG: SpoIID/LytB protein, partial [Chloroflexi bacterium]|nr:SpoIID/LytB protein [Chloroflexota bacterium]